MKSVKVDGRMNKSKTVYVFLILILIITFINIYYVKKDKYIIKTFDTTNTRYYVISGNEFESLLNLINY